MAEAVINDMSGTWPDACEELGSNLLSLLTNKQIVPGSDPSYELCKIIDLYHPLGDKMASAPIKMAQSQKRTITVPNAPEEVVKQFLRGEEKLKCPNHILNLKRLSRVYGMASIALGCEDFPTDKPLVMRDLWKLPIFFNVFDPLNMAGSVVNNQIPNTPNFNQANRLCVQGRGWHISRFQIVMNEDPVYINFVASTFGYTGRSVYQRALFPLKSYIKTMAANDAIASKIALIVFKMKSPGGIVNRIMEMINAIKRRILKAAHTGEVVTIGVEEEIETLDMQNVDGAGTFARDNILKDCATAADMPAKLLQNETMIGGMAEGTEDAKTIAKYIDGVRLELKINYDFCDNIVQYYSWMDPNFWARLKEIDPDYCENKTHDMAFVEWVRDFKATWPSLLTEPESESVKTEEVKCEACLDAVETFFDRVDPETQAIILEAALQNIFSNKNLFPYGIEEIDPKKLRDFLAERKEQADEAHEFAVTEPPAPGAAGGGGARTKSKADSIAGRRLSRERLHAAVRRLEGPPKPVAVAAQG